jgi:hypothetical protein
MSDDPLGQAASEGPTPKSAKMAAGRWVCPPSGIALQGAKSGATGEPFKEESRMPASSRAKAAADSALRPSRSHPGNYGPPCGSSEGFDDPAFFPSRSLLPLQRRRS